MFRAGRGPVVDCLAVRLLPFELMQSRSTPNPVGRFGTWLVVSAALAVVAAYFGLAANVAWPSGVPMRPTNFLGLQAEGFKTGQLDLPIEIPAGFRQLPNPYDPVANASFRRGLHDVSYYQGKLYLYFGVTPTLLLYLPVSLLTGKTLSPEWAVAIFCTLGFLAVTSVLWEWRKKYFPAVPLGVLACAVLAVGLGTTLPLLLMRPDIYEVTISCAYALTMVALLCLWRAMTRSRTRSRWLLLASVAYGLAVAARPSVLFGAAILLIPVLSRKILGGRSRWRDLGFTVVPLCVIGLGLMSYNAARFGDPLQFGQRYQLAGVNVHDAGRLFSPDFFWFNFRLYFLERGSWSGQFPFVNGLRVPPLPDGYFGVENPFGVFANLPLMWLAFGLPFLKRPFGDDRRGVSVAMAIGLALLFAAAAGTLCFFGGACSRYEAEFLTPLMLLSLLTVFGLENQWAARPRRRVWFRMLWGPAWAVSIAFACLIGLSSTGLYASRQHIMGYALLDAHRLPEAVAHFRRAILCYPNFAEAHCNWGAAAFEAGNTPEAIGHFETAVRIVPSFAEARHNLAIALMKIGKLEEAQRHFGLIARFSPDYPGAKEDLQRVEMLLRASARPPTVGQ